MGRFCILENEEPHDQREGARLWLPMFLAVAPSPMIRRKVREVGENSLVHKRLSHFSSPIVLSTARRVSSNRPSKVIVVPFLHQYGGPFLQHKWRVRIRDVQESRLELIPTGILRALSEDIETLFSRRKIMAT